MCFLPTVQDYYVWSKNFPEYRWNTDTFLHMTTVVIRHLTTTDTVFAVNIVPGLVEGENHTSFKINGTDHQYLRVEETFLVVDDEETSTLKDTFNEDATFIQHDDYFFPGN